MERALRSGRPAALESRRATREETYGQSQPKIPAVTSA
jgi:hypothetical protein